MTPLMVGMMLMLCCVRLKGFVGVGTDAKASKLGL